MLSPRQAFEDNIRPAVLLLRVYRLLENDTVHTEHELVTAMRQLLSASADEELMLIHNSIFVGLIREGAQMPRASLKKASLCNLLRQSVVTACTALETYLPSLLRENLPTVIAVKGRSFFPADKDVQKSFEGMTFNLPETLRLLNEPDAPQYIANKLLSFINFKYLSGSKGIYSVATLLTIDDAWNRISERLGQNVDSIQKQIDDTVGRRNDIVHRADRSQRKPDSDVQEIGYAWSKQSIDIIANVGYALDELVEARIGELKAEILASKLESQTGLALPLETA
ncbi:MAG: HEPN domain-containing protein [Pyrinomonadaceae bacterium]